MKRTIFTMILIALVSCNDNKKEKLETKTDSFEYKTEVVDEHHQDKPSSVYDNTTWMAEIKLDNGKKWNANIETNEGVKRMQNVLKSQQTTSLEEYHKLAEQLNVDKNYVIKECTMQGASHDNLHVWLVPLIEKIEALTETKTLDDAAKIKQSIEENINGYYNFFE